MSKYMIRGGRLLRGELTVQGAKNAALPMMAAALMTDGQTAISRCPVITDIYYMRRILEMLGCETCHSEGTLHIRAKNACSLRGLPSELAGKLRSSVFMLGPMLARFGCAECAYPGGCAIGKRPIDIHLQVLSALGVQIEEEQGFVRCRCGLMRGAEVCLPYPSVGATENALMAATAAAGETVIRNAAREPEICALSDMLSAMGAQIEGAGTGTVRIQGGRSLCGACCRCMPDRIAAATLICAVAAAGGDVLLRDADRTHLAALEETAAGSGIELTDAEGGLRVRRTGALRPFGAASTAPYPGFPTDMQALLCAAACFAEGDTLVRETVFESRMKHIDQLRRMGASIELRGSSAVIHGRGALRSAELAAEDLRGGAALTIAALGAEGESSVGNVAVIDRGYESLESALASIGADIYRIED